MNFTDLELKEPILSAVSKAKYETPSPIQEKAIPVMLEGKDIVACAQTGTGKTAAFALPILNKLEYKKKHQIRALVLCALQHCQTTSKTELMNYYMTQWIFVWPHQQVQPKQLPSILYTVKRQIRSVS